LRPKDFKSTGRFHQKMRENRFDLGRPLAVAQKHVATLVGTVVGMWGRESDRQNQQRHNNSGTGSGGNGPGCACGESSEVEVETMVTAAESETVGDSDNAFIPFGIYSN
jgi:hypothetical protein